LETPTRSTMPFTGTSSRRSPSTDLRLGDAVAHRSASSVHDSSRYSARSMDGCPDVLAGLRVSLRCASPGSRAATSAPQARPDHPCE
jgi:hypothetical protein